ncbi:MAG: SGNH hydrolase domain-containing protein, partial [Pseudomonadota bacterium]
SELAALDIALVLAVSFVLAIACTVFVETPFRTRVAHARPARSVLAVSIAGLAVAGVAGGVSARAAPSIQDWSADVLWLDQFASYHRSPAGQRVTDADGCMLHDASPGGFDGFNRKACLPAGIDAKGSVLLIGDSHAGHLIVALREALKPRQVHSAAAARCAPLMGSDRFTSDHYCSKLMTFVFEQHIANAGIDTVVLSARWQASETEALTTTAAHLAKLVRRVIVLGPTVEYSMPFPQALARDQHFGSAIVARSQKLAPSRLDAQWAKVKWPNGVTYISLYDLLCAEPSRRARSCQRTVTSSQTGTSVPMHFDYGHYTLEAARNVARRLVNETSLSAN